MNTPYKGSESKSLMIMNTLYAAYAANNKPDSFMTKLIGVSSNLSSIMLSKNIKAAFACITNAAGSSKIGRHNSSALFESAKTKNSATLSQKYRDLRKSYLLLSAKP